MIPVLSPIKVDLSSQIRIDLVSSINSYFNNKSREDSIGLHSISIPIPRCNILAWLNKQTTLNRFYIEHHQEQKIVGTIDSINSIKTLNEDSISYIQDDLNSSPSVSYFGGRPFSSHQNSDECWSQVPATHYFLPFIKIESSQNNSSLTCHIRISEQSPLDTQLNDVIHNLQSIQFDEGSFENETPTILSKRYLPEFSAWESKIKTIQTDIDSEKIEKMVLSRRVDLQLKENCNPLSLLETLKSRKKKGVSFLYQWGTDDVFIGSSPELLFKRDHQNVTSMALAGTTHSGKNEVETLALKKTLLSDPKEKMEHHYVEKTISKQLLSCCKSIKMGTEKSVLCHDYIQHIYSEVSGILDPQKTDFDIIDALHPTPAIGGFPVEKSQTYINEIEPFKRGWYAGLLGELSKDGSIMAVGIRSACCKKNQVHLFSGAGIVKKSEPKKEWDELDLKIQPFNELFSN